MEQVLREFSEHIHRTHFPAISDDDWEFVTEKDYGVLFGFKPNVSRYRRWNEVYANEGYFKFYFTNEIASFHSSGWNKQESKKIKYIESELIAFLKKKQVDLLYNTYDQFFKN